MKRKPQTNFKRVTQSVDKLAKLIDRCVCANCDNCPVDYDTECCEPACVDNIKKWLLKKEEN